MSTEVIAAIVGGLIGILGSVAAIITNHLLTSVGKITAYLSSSRFEYSKQDSGGFQGKIESIKEADMLNVSLGVDIYNSSDIPRNLREFKIELQSKNSNSIFSAPPSVYVESGGTMPFEKLETINLMPKIIEHKDMQLWVGKEHLASFAGPIIVSLTGLYPNGRKFKVKLLTRELK